MTLVIGIDLGGTKIAGAVWDSEAQTVRAQKTIPTQGKLGPDGVLERIAKLVRELAESVDLSVAEVAGVGLGVPATFDAERGEIHLIPNLPGDWYGKPVVRILQEALGCPVHLINDARAFTLAEATIGAGRGTSACIGLTLGTGVGGGIAINGRLYLGLGAAGEFGHITLDPHGPPDGAGIHGGWEGMIGGPAIAGMAMRVVAQGHSSKIGALVDYDLNKITPEVIAQAAEQGDAIAQGILHTAGKNLGIGLASIITILAPECVVIGGGVAQLGKWITEPMRVSLRERVKTVNLDQVRIVPAALGGEAGVIGAAIWASQEGKAN